MVNIPAHFMGEFIIPFFVLEKRIYGVQKSELFKIGLTDKTFNMFRNCMLQCFLFVPWHMSRVSVSKSQPLTHLTQFFTSGLTHC